MLTSDSYCNKSYLILAFFLCYSYFGSAQYQAYNWYFNDSTGVTFKTSPPSAISTSVMYYPNDGPLEGASSISDSAGNILFYADPRQIWNSGNQLMPNGQGLLGGASSTQGVIIIPQPGHDSLYYVFTLDEQQDSLKHGLNYSIVDMCLECGKGDVLPGHKNIHLLDTASEKMAATYHANGNDIWIVVHKYFTDEFYAYLLTKSGLSKPIISHCGVKQADPFNPGVYGAMIWGQMKISPNGKKIAFGLSGTDTVYGSSGLHELFDFDNSTGKVSNEIQLSKRYYYTYGVAFSPDNSKLYISCFASYSPSKQCDEVLIQYDLSLSNPAHSDSFITCMYAAQLQLAPDGKIYFPNFYTGHHLSCISNPNERGVPCNYVAEAISLGTKRPDLGLPSFIDNFVYHNKGRKCGRKIAKADTTLCPNTVYQIKPPKSTSGYVWQDGSTDSVYTVKDSGTYTVQFTAQGTCSETYSMDVSYRAPITIRIPSDTIICPGTSYTINLPTLGGRSYTWSNGHHSNSFFVFEAGKYFVTETYQGCKASDTFHVSVFDTAITIPHIPHDTSICPGQNIIIDLQSINYPIKWQDGSTNKLYIIQDSGAYSFTIKSCSAHRWNIRVKYSANPIKPFSDTTLCSDTIYVARIPAADSSFKRVWSNGSDADSLVIPKQGTYWVQFKDGACTIKDNFTVTYQSPPGQLLPPDTNLCPGKDIVLNIPSSTGNLTWQDGSKDTTYLITRPGTYTLSVTNACGNFSKSIQVKIDTIKFNIGKNIPVCEDSILHLDETGKGDSYLWYDGSTSPAISISRPGYYWVEITKKGCIATDTFVVNFDYGYANKRFLPEDTTICIGKDIKISLDTTIGKLLWYNGSQSNSITISDPGSYSATLTNACGSFPESFNVSSLDCSCPVYAPSAFTPNKDSINPVFNIISQCRFKNFNLKIYNRWGELIFSTDESGKGWDGTFKGSICEDGIYLWILEGQNILNKLVFQYGEVALLK